MYIFAIIKVNKYKINKEMNAFLSLFIPRSVWYNNVIQKKKKSVTKLKKKMFIKYKRNI